MNGDSIISIKNLEKIYDDGEVRTPALSGVSFDIKEGEFGAIMGPAGSGKSTLLHILGFLDRPSGGSYKFEGISMEKYSDEELAKLRNQKFGFIFQSFNLLARTSVLDNVKLPLQYGDLPEAKQDQLAGDSIEAVGMNHGLRDASSQLSGGERQRVAIARALVNNPAVIFADEPTGNLDSKSGSQVMEFVDKLHEQGHTIILITHETYTAEYAQRIIRLKDGRVDSDEKVTQRHKDGLIK